jgi:hypothetical protein
MKYYSSMQIHIHTYMNTLSHTYAHTWSDDEAYNALMGGEFIGKHAPIFALVTCNRALLHGGMHALDMSSQ